MNQDIKKPRIAVIGAGVSGLATAWYLQKYAPTAEIHVVEASQDVGGVIQTKYQDPYLIELGADNFATLVPDAKEWVEELGLRQEFLSPKSDHRIAQVIRDGKLIPIPNGFSLMQPTNLWSVLSTPSLSMAGRLRLIGEYFIKPRTSQEDESVESFAVRRFGRECFDRLIEPIVGGIFTARSETLSMQATMPQFVEMERQYGGLIRATLAKRRSRAAAEEMARKASGARYDQFMAPKKGMSWWLQTVASKLNRPIMFRTTVVDVARDSAGSWRLNLSRTNETSVEPLCCDAVCIAVPSHRASVLVEKSHPQLAKQLQRIPYASSAVGVFAIEKNEIATSALCFGIVVPKIENRNCLAISLASEKYEGRCPDNVVIARVFMGGAVRPELMELSDARLLEMANQELHAMLGITSIPRSQTLVRWNNAMPQYLVGHMQLASSIRQSLAADPTLKLVGNAYDGVGIPQCVRLAKQTAKDLVTTLQTGGPR